MIKRFDEDYFKSLKTSKEREEYYISFVKEVLDTIDKKEEKKNVNWL